MAVGHRVAGRHRAGLLPRALHTWLGVGAIAVGVGAALAGGSGVAHADGAESDGSGSASSQGAGTSSGSTSSGASATTHESGESHAAESVSSVGSSSVGSSSAGSTGAASSSAGASPKPSSAKKSATSAKSATAPAADAGTPAISTPATSTTATSTTVPSPSDATETPYGDIGKWLLQSNGKISNFGNQPLHGKTLLEPINLVILDPTSTSVKESTKKLNAAMTGAGFPAQPVHTPGFRGAIDGETYSQQPTGFVDAFSDDFFLLPDDHARAFGPAPAEDGTGYVWTAAVSREKFGFNGLIPAHIFISFNAGRDELARQLVGKGATLVGMVDLGNAYDSATLTTGDNDGYAVVIRLNDPGTVVDPAPTPGMRIGRERLVVAEMCDATPQVGTPNQCLLAAT